MSNDRDRPQSYRNYSVRFYICDIRNSHLIFAEIKMSKKMFIIRRERQDNRAYICQQIMQGQEGEIVRISDPTRTLAQNALIHAVLTEAGDLIGWKFSGQQVDLDDLKSIFMAAYRKASGVDTRFVMGIDGQPVILNWRTRDMTKRECSEFTEMIYAWMEEFKRGNK